MSLSAGAATPSCTLSPRDYDAVLFDLDGVLTRTASVHAAAWKRLFDEFLRRRSADTGEPFVPFDIDADYRRHVDGKPRYAGVAAFLKSRGIELPQGAQEDGPGVQSVRALGHLKDKYFLEHLEQRGVEPYEAAITLVRALRAQQIKTAVVSSSNNCAKVLETTGIAHLFDARVDGKDITRLGLKGKPAPDAFLEAARRLGIEPSRAVVVEDAIAGIEAGRAGRFGCVIGVDRGGQSLALREAGADVVVTDLAQVRVTAEPPSEWSLVFDGFDPAHEGIRETLCTLGNGYFATRASAAWAVADDTHYPGTYLAGGYNRLRTDIAGRVIDHMLGVSGEDALALLTEPCLVVAHDLSPSTTAQLDPKKVLGFATDQGGRTSHTAIMARKLGIPAVVGFGNITQKLRAGDYALLDGHSGTLVVAPTDQTLFAYGQLQQRHVALTEKLRELRDQPAVTFDGQGIILAANIESPADLSAVRAAGAAGVGLFRTEFLFLHRATPPTEDEQYSAYRAVAEGCAPDSVIIRTLDLGGDKLPANLALAGEPNPFLGWRAIRISLVRHDLFRAQLRAILRASAHGPVKLLYPMISGLAELRAANAFLDGCREELRREGHAFDATMEVGVMIEIPSAVLIADQLARECDFFSLGTNDLTGYTLAVDRLNERVAHLYTPTHPAVIKLIALTVAAARRHGRWVGVCGEMAGEPALVPLLVGLGVDELSATPRVIPAVKFLLRRLKVTEAKALADAALESDCPNKILEQSRQLAHAIAPDLFGETSGG